MNLAAIGSAIAARFDAPAITPPSGYNDVALATHELPNAITSLPTALVFPPDSTFSYGPAVRTGDLRFPVRFYVEQAADRPRAAASLYAWYGVLIEQVVGDYDLGQSTAGVTHAVISGSRAGTLPYADVEYVGLEFDVLVHLAEGINPTT